MNKKKKRKNKPYAQRLIPLIIFAVVAYTIADIILQAKYGVEISPTLTSVYFVFWTSELIGLATIKNKKIKNSYSSTSDEVEELHED